MSKDRKVVLPRSMGEFTIPGESENNKGVRYSISFRDLEYRICRDDSVAIQGTSILRKEELFLGKKLPKWLQFFLAWTVWEFRTWRLSCLADYRTDLASEALNGGIILDKAFFAELCVVPDKHIADLQQKIADARFPLRRVRVVKAA